MNIEISYRELQGLISQFSNQNISLSYQNPDSVKVTVFKKVIGFNVNQDVYLYPKVVGSSLLELRYDGNKITNVAVGLGLAWVKANPKLSGLIVSDSDQVILIDISKIKKLEQVFETIQLSKLYLNNVGLRLEASLK